MKQVRRILFLESVAESLPDNDLVSQQRFRLFRITTVFSLLAYLGLLFQVMVVFPGSSPVMKIISTLFICLFANYFGLIFHKKQNLAYIGLVMILFTLLHIITYYSGGVRNSGMFYLAGMIFIAYMLLGSKGGKAMSLISVIHIIYFYLVNRYTGWVSYALVGNEPAMIDTDFLITGLISVLVLTSQSNYIEKSKNAIISDINSKKNELGVKNIELEKLSLVASKTNNGVLISDCDGKVEWVNEGFTRLMGYTFEEIVGKRYDQMIRIDDVNHEAMGLLKQNLLNKESSTEEILSYHKKGHKIWVQINITPILDNHENILKYIIIESDITARKIAEKKMGEYLNDLEKTIKELDKFGYIVSHDLKAPLRAIGNLTEWIEEDLGNAASGEILKNFNTIKGRVVRMEALINGILDYSKAGKNNGPQISFDTKLLLKETFDLIGASEKCTLEIGPGMPVLLTDKIKLQQTFMNIISNGIKFNDKQQVIIKVKVFEEKDFWHFSITDNGPGIEQRYQEKIFVIFQTLNARDQLESTGVGLAIVKKIIEDKGGQIWIDSEMGKGTTFHFTWAKSHSKNPEDISQSEYAPDFSNDRVEFRNNRPNLNFVKW